MQFDQPDNCLGGLWRGDLRGRLGQPAGLVFAILVRNHGLADPTTGDKPNALSASASSSLKVASPSGC